MSTEKIEHTPGPYNSSPTASLGPQFAVYTEAEGRTIAVVYDQTGHGDTRATARVLAAAPELLEAAQNARNVLAALATGQLDSVRADSPALAMLRAAIAKATNGEG